jgi:phospholipase C
MRLKQLGIAGALCGVVALAAVATLVASPRAAHADVPTHAASGIPRYQHIFYIMMENHSYEEVIGSPNAPQINQLANTYGLATNSWGVTHPSEPNYVAAVSGSFYGITDDASPYTVHPINAPYLGSQLENVGLTWKSYQQSIPSVGFTGDYSPFPAQPAKLYAAKHNPFINFLTSYPASQQAAERAKIVPDTQLATDLQNNTVPNFSFIAPNQCYDMHGTAGCTDDAQLLAAGDQYVASTVQMIMESKAWQTGNNAIIVTWDENDFSATNGVPNIASAGGHVATIVIANHGPRGVRYDAPVNHYSVLLSIQDAFHLGCLQASCPTPGGVQPMTPLFVASGN